MKNKKQRLALQLNLFSWYIMTNQKIVFLIATLSLLIIHPLLPIPLIAYAPYLMSILMHHSLKKVLWHSILCGIIVDLFQSTLPFGYSALGYLLASLIIYRQKWWFFNDKLGSLSFFVALFSLLFSLFQLITFKLQNHPITLSWYSLLSDFVLMPVCDGLYAFICFTSPLLIYSQIKKRGFHFLFIRKVN